ncbi:hypothetical protein [Salibacterium sp. K-3]
MQETGGDDQVKTAAGLILGAGLLSQLTDFSFPNDLFFQKEPAAVQEQEEDTSGEEQWDELWNEAKEEAEQADEDTRTEEEKLEDFDEEWEQFGENDSSDSAQADPDSSGTDTFGDFPSLNGWEEPETEDTSESGFEETWNEFGQTFEDTYEKTEESFDWENSFDSRSGTYEETE